MRPYATREQMQKVWKELHELSKTVLKLAESHNDMAKWFAYEKIKVDPTQFSKQDKEMILEKSKGHITHVLFLNLFKEVAT